MPLAPWQARRRSKSSKGGPNRSHPAPRFRDPGFEIEAALRHVIVDGISTRRGYGRMNSTAVYEPQFHWFLECRFVEEQILGADAESSLGKDRALRSRTAGRAGPHAARWK